MLNGIKKIKIPKNPFVLFAPFLLLYIVLIIIFPTDGMFGDESRYLIYAEYIIKFFHPDIIDGFDYLGNGPGYPVILVPFVALHLPFICITLLNAVFYYFSIVLLFKTLIQFTSFTSALVVSLFWACYYNLYEYLMLIYTETFITFLISLLVFCIVNAFKSGASKKSIYLAGIVFGYIALTKPIFGYILLCLLICMGLLWIMNRKVINYRKGILILIVALATTSPYLIYTYHVTGKIFYWSSFGGNNLYWMSTPFNGEYGDWIRDPVEINESNPKYVKGYKAIITSNHQKDYEEINKYTGLERDDAYKRIAIKNIKSHPAKFLENCFCNIGRILFNYPYSYTLQKTSTLIRIPLNGIITVLALFCIIPTFKNWKKINFPIRFMLFMVLFYLGASVLGSAETRMFTMIVPILLVWIAFIIQRTIRVNLKSWVN
ncbi:MAG: glycosyltransferase family 39 protein [Ferruginibacter sp.]